MTITINGKKENLSGDSIALTKLLEIKDVESPDMVSTQLNGKFVDRGDYASTMIRDGDEIEFLYFMGGG